MSDKLKVLKNVNLVLAVYILIAVLGSIGQHLKGVQIFAGQEYTHYNNFIIFKYAFFNLIKGNDLYVRYPDLFWDYFKYSPTFALLMVPLAILPNLAGLILWNLLNALSLFFAIKTIPVKEINIKTYILWIVSIELLISIQNAQSNALMVALIILAFNAFEKRNVMGAALLIILSFYIKLFGLGAALLFFLYSDKFKFLAYSLIWICIFGLLPLLVVSPDQLLFLYKSWANLLINDQSSSYGLSVMGVIQSWFNSVPDKFWIVLAGTIIMSIPLMSHRSYRSQQFRFLMLASLLIWMVIFNHKAESPTYIIAMCGVGIWYFTQERKPEHLILLIFAFVFTSLSRTDLFPRYVRNQIFSPYKLTALPCILIWLKIEYDLITKELIPGLWRGNRFFNRPKSSS